MLSAHKQLLGQIPGETEARLVDVKHGSAPEITLLNVAGMS